MYFEYKVIYIYKIGDKHEALDLDDIVVEIKKENLHFWSPNYPWLKTPHNIALPKNQPEHRKEQAYDSQNPKYFKKHKVEPFIINKEELIKAIHYFDPALRISQESETKDLLKLLPKHYAVLLTFRNHIKRYLKFPPPTISQKDFEKSIAEFNDLNLKTVKNIEDSLPDIFREIRYEFFPKSKVFFETVYRSFHIDSNHIKSKLTNNEKLLIEDLAQPPSNLCNSTERLNIPKNPVFYGCFHPIGSILELKEKIINDTYLIGCWKNKFGNLPNSILFNNYIKIGLNSIRINYDRNFSNNLDKETRNVYIDYMNFVAHQLTDYEHSTKSIYKFTSFIGHDILYKKKIVDSIIYPTAQIFKLKVKFPEYDFSNIAIHPDYISNSMYLEKVLKVKYNGIEQINELELLEIGIPNKKGEIDFNKPTKNDQYAIQTFNNYELFQFQLMMY